MGWQNTWLLEEFLLSEMQAEAGSGAEASGLNKGAGLTALSSKGVRCAYTGQADSGASSG